MARQLGTTVASLFQLGFMPHSIPDLRRKVGSKTIAGIRPLTARQTDRVTPTKKAFRQDVGHRVSPSMSDHGSARPFPAGRESVARPRTYYPQRLGSLRVTDVLQPSLPIVPWGLSIPGQPAAASRITPRSPPPERKDPRTDPAPPTSPHLRKSSRLSSR